MTQKSATEHLDTIAAIATPPGIGGISVIRISGKDSIRIADNIFKGNISLTSAPTHTVHHGRVVDRSHQTIDEVLATVFREPQSYTGENSVEISCHGGLVVIKNILSRILECDVRHAGPGEFTKRAFLNGKIDLAQAEAVADLIFAESEQAAYASLQQLEGKLSSYVKSIRDQLMHTVSMLELSLDFAEEDIVIAAREEHLKNIDSSLQLIKHALETYSTGRIIREGLKVCLIGKPNTGKSSLLNAILGTRRAIVTHIPGTTRDFIEESMNVKGNMIRFVDTAGLRDTADIIEREGIDFSLSHVSSSDIVCDVIDVSTVDFIEDFIQNDLSWLKDHSVNASRIIFVLNKSDLVSEHLQKIVNSMKNADVDFFITSALHRTGIDEMLDWISMYARDMSRKTIASDVMVTNSRHALCLQKAEENLHRSKKAIEDNLTEEFIALEIRETCDALGEIIGEVTSEDILNNIFSRFCIGK